MKKTFFKISAFLLLLALMGAGCEEDEELLWEISPGSKTAVIQKEVDGIEFKFCLLNEKGEPATVFKEGENFSFYFSVTNKSGKKLYFDADFAQTNRNDFCKVYTSENQDLGKPFKVLTVLTIGSGAYPFDSSESYTFQQQWSDIRDSVWFWEKATYESTHKQPLEKGNYYTGFKYRFQFEGEQPVHTDSLNFKINFKIQ